MARKRRRKSKLTDEESDSEGTTSRSSGNSPSGGGIWSGLTTMTDTPYIPIYPEDRATVASLVTFMNARNSAWTPGNETSKLVQPIRITQPDTVDNPLPGQITYQNGFEWIGDTDLALSTMMESMPRIITTPGDLTDVQIRAAFQTYMEGVIDLLAVYLPIAALKGYSEAYPTLAGYIDNYLASVGAKPWERKQMQTVFRSLPMPSRLVSFLTDFYSVKQHPRVPNLHHFIPLVGSNTIETGGGPTGNCNTIFQGMYATLQAIPNYSEFISYLKLAGYQIFEFPDSIAPTADAATWERLVDGCPAAGSSLNGVATSQLQLPTSGYKDRITTVQEYVEDLGPGFTRGILPQYQIPSSNGWLPARASAQNQGLPIDTSVVTMTGWIPNADAVGANVFSSRVGFLAWSLPGGTPAMMGSPGTAISSAFADALRSMASKNWRHVLQAENGTAWEVAMLAQLPLSAEEQIRESSTTDSNTYTPSGGAPGAPGTGSNPSNLKLIYDSFLTPGG